MPAFFRIVGSRWVASALDGEGSRRHGGRWNPRGIGAVYFTESRALAALEILVHFGRGVVHQTWSLLETEIPEELLDAIDTDDLPTGWDGYETLEVSQEVGGNWLEAGEKLGLRLPSAIIPQERILLVNPGHPRFREMVVRSPREFRFDPRLGSAADPTTGSGRG